MTLYPYQVKALRRLMKGRRTVLVSPTGSGKTLMGAVWVKRRAKCTLWVAHRLQLLRQAHETLTAAGVKAYVWHGDERDPPKNCKCLLVTVQTLARHPHLLDDGWATDGLVIDEAHRATTPSYKAALDAVHPKSGRVLGLTATPWRLDGQGLGSVFDSIVVASSMRQLIDERHMVEPKVYAPSLATYLSVHKAIKVDRDNAEAGKRMIVLAGRTVSETLKHAKRRAALVFAVNKKHGKALERAFRKADRRTAYVDDATPERKRQSVLSDVRSGKVDLVVNVSVFAEGLDCKELGVVTLARPTNSLTMMLQQCGRAMRSDRPIIVDVAGNVHGLGTPIDEPPWSLEDRSEGVEKSSTCTVSKVRFCADGHANPRHAETCMACGAELNPCEIIEAEVPLELIKLRDRIFNEMPKLGFSPRATRLFAEAVAS